MLDLHIEQWTPKFILADHNGYAMAKAIEAGLQHMNRTVKEGVDVLTDYETMPEWRLDELAWEYNIPFDFTADIDKKRAWIKNFQSMYALCGTPAGIEQSLKTEDTEATVTEWWEYGGSPYHFRVRLKHPARETDIAWAEKIIYQMKNERSVLDRLDEEVI